MFATRVRCSWLSRPRPRGATFFVLVPTLLMIALTPRLPAANQDEISQAIDKGIDFLLGKAEEKQMGRADNWATGQVALETYALVVAGVSVDHPVIQKNFETLQKMSLTHTYVVSCYAFALDAAINQIHQDMQFLGGKLIPDGPRIGKEYRAQLEKCIRALTKIVDKKQGRFNYTAGGNQFDNSNTQFGVLGLGLALKRKIPVDRAIWEAIALHFINGQQPKGPKVEERLELLPPEERGEDSKDRITLIDKDRKKGEKERERKEKDEKGKTVVVKKAAPEFGDEDLEVFARGWSYRDSAEHGGYKWTMGCAGLSSLILAKLNLDGKIPPDFQNKVNTAIRDGYGWLMKNWNIQGGGGWKYYGIYSLEKVGDLGHVKKFGKHDWYQEVSDLVVKEQKADGSWPGGKEDKTRENTAFALLVLNRATSLLTQRSNRMVITGPGAERADRGDRDKWVYIQSMDRELHFPSVFRMVRLRPSAKALKFVDMVVENYPPEKKGILIPDLVKLYRGLEKNGKRVQKVLLGNMGSITMSDYENVDQFLSWFQRWKTADEAGEKVKKDAKDEILKLYREEADSVPLRRKIIWALSRLRAKEAAPLFVRDLRHSSELIRSVAYDGLSVLPFGTPPPRFDAKLKGRKSEDQLKAIEEWLASVNR